MICQVISDMVPNMVMSIVREELQSESLRIIIRKEVRSELQSFYDRISTFIEIIIKLFSLTEKFMLSKLPKWKKVEKQTTEAVVTHIASHPLVVEGDETEEVMVELLLKEDEPLELVLVVEEEVRKKVVFVLGNESKEAKK